jgi:hypothetical protein
METVEGGYTFAPDRRWQTFLRSRTLAAILLAGCVFGVQMARSGCSGHQRS